MVNDKNHLFGPFDIVKDRKDINKKNTQQQYSRFSTAAALSINSANIASTSPALQTNSKPQIGEPYDDTKGIVGASTQVVFFDDYGSSYTFYEVTGDVEFAFDELPTGRWIYFTLDILVDLVAGVTLTFPQVTNPPVLAGNDGDRYVLTFVGVNRSDPTGVSPPVSTYTFLNEGGAAGNSFPIIWPKVDLTPAISATVTIDLSLTTGNAKQIQFPAGDISLAITGDPLSSQAEEVHVMFIQDGTGGRSLTSVDAAIKNGGTMDTLLDKGTNAKTIFKLVTLDGGVSYHAELIDLTTGNEFFGPWTATHDAGNQLLTNLGILESNAANLPNSGFIRMGTAEEIRMRNPGNSDDLIITSGNDAAANQAILFNVAGGNQLTISALDIDVVLNDIINTADVLPGAGTHQVGTAGDFYNQMHSQYFVPEAAAIVTNRYGFSKNGNTLYVNYDNTPADAGFGIFEEGIQQFLFSNPLAGEVELFIGPDPFQAGDIFRILMGENSNSSAKIEYNDTDLLVERLGVTSNNGVRLRTRGISRLYATVTDVSILNAPLNLNANEIQQVVDVTSNGGGGPTTGTIGELITDDGGFDYFMRNRLTWESDADTYIQYDAGGIDVVSDDSILLQAINTGQNITLSSQDAMLFATVGSVGVNFLVNAVTRLTVQDNALVVTDNVDILCLNDNLNDIGTLSDAFGFIFTKGGVGIVEGYATGFKPTGQTNTGIIFTVPTAGGKTELRCSFQTGGSVLIVTEP